MAREADIDTVRLDLWVIRDVNLRRRELERLEESLDRADVEAARDLLGVEEEVSSNAFIS